MGAQAWQPSEIWVQVPADLRASGSRGPGGLVLAPPGLGAQICLGKRRVASRPTDQARGKLLGIAELPAAWRIQFWKSSGAQALYRLNFKQVAELVPSQAGIRFCPCPACGADDRDDPLVWTIEQPKVLKCRRCGVSLPNDKYPAKVNKEIPEETVQVLPGVLHHYPYHAVEEGKARFPEERVYLQAKIDHEARKYLAKAALYAAAEYRAAGWQGSAIASSPFWRV